MDTIDPNGKADFTGANTWPYIVRQTGQAHPIHYAWYLQLMYRSGCN